MMANTVQFYAHDGLVSILFDDECEEQPAPKVAFDDDALLLGPCCCLCPLCCPSWGTPLAVSISFDGIVDDLCEECEEWNDSSPFTPCDYHMVHQGDYVGHADCYWYKFISPTICDCNIVYGQLKHDPIEEILEARIGVGQTVDPTTFLTADAMWYLCNTNVPFPIDCRTLNISFPDPSDCWVDIYEMDDCDLTNATGSMTAIPASPELTPERFLRGLRRRKKRGGAYADTMEKWIKAGKPTRPSEEIRRILFEYCQRSDPQDVARHCHLLKGGLCTHHGCKRTTGGIPVGDLIYMATSRCPIGIWT